MTTAEDILNELSEDILFSSFNHAVLETKYIKEKYDVNSITAKVLRDVFFVNDDTVIDQHLIHRITNYIPDVTDLLVRGFITQAYDVIVTLIGRECSRYMLDYEFAQMAMSGKIIGTVGICVITDTVFNMDKYTGTVIYLGKVDNGYEYCVIYRGYSLAEQFSELEF